MAYQLPLKRVVLALGAALTLGLGAAQAAPSLQSCAPMEVTHTGTIGLSYTMSCTAGGWHLRYTGAVPAGSDEVNVQYQLQVRGADGASFNQQRMLTLPSPAHLGQMLAREAVLLDGGDLALRECKEPHCTLYRPLGHQKGLSQATVTIPPEVQKLRLEREQLAVQLSEKSSLAASQAQHLEQLTAALAAAQAQLAAQPTLTQNEQATDEASSRSKLNALTVSFETVTAERNQLKSELYAKQTELETAQTSLTAALAEQTRLATALAQVQTQLEPPSDETQSLREQLHLLDAKSRTLEAALAEATATADQYRTQLSQLDTAATGEAIADLAEQLQATENLRAQLQQVITEKDGELQTLKTQVSQLEAEHLTITNEQESFWKSTISSLLDDRHAARVKARQAEEALAASQTREAQLQAELEELKRTHLH